jgi:hypothetical protein
LKSSLDEEVARRVSAERAAVKLEERLKVTVRAVDEKQMRIDELQMSIVSTQATTSLLSVAPVDSGVSSSNISAPTAPTQIMVTSVQLPPLPPTARHTFASSTKQPAIPSFEPAVEKTLPATAAPIAQHSPRDEIVDLTGDDAVSLLPAYEGQTVNGLPHGQGVVTFMEGKWKGCVYRGDFEHGVMSGTGTLTREGVYEYTGEWKEDGVQDCVGEMRYLSGKFAGCVYEGAFISTSFRDSAASLGRRHGHGTMRYANGDVYTGEWMTGFPSGRGEIAYSGGVKYAGQWNNGSKGYGVTTLPPVEMFWCD